MGKRDPRIDAYIARQRDFAKPIMTYLREVIHEGCPDCEETLKWSSPSFMYHGGILCGFAGFKEHAIFGFWKAPLLLGSAAVTGEAAGSYRNKLTSVKDLPPKRELVALVKKAAKLNEDGVKVPRRAAKPKKAIPMPADLKRALAKNAGARTHYAAFSPGKQRDYLEWITEARSADTRQRRLVQAVQWMSEGKSRNWKYE